MQSVQRATLLSGRYIEIHIFPLSFKEYSSMLFSNNKFDNFRHYLENSSLLYSLT
jgi:predicted AAA+ superfamily ATPase